MEKKNTLAPAEGRRAGKGTIGAWTVVVIFVLGLSFVGGLFYFYFHNRRAAYDASSVGAPDAPLRVVAVWMGDAAADDSAFAQVAGRTPDVMLLFNIDEARLEGLQKRLGFGKSAAGRIFDARSRSGILCRFALYGGEPLDGKGCFVETVAGTRRFAVACAMPGSAAILKERQRAAGDGALMAAGEIDSTAAEQLGLRGGESAPATLPAGAAGPLLRLMTTVDWSTSPVEHVGLPGRGWLLEETAAGKGPAQ